MSLSLKSLICTAVIFLFGANIANGITRNEQKSVVRLDIYVNSTLVAWGSGVVIDSSGRLITNYHVIEDVVLKPEYSTIEVCITSDATSPPLCSMRADVLDYWKEADLALLQIAEVNLTSLGAISLDEHRLRFGSNPSNLGFVEFDKTAITESVELSDKLQILGYPSYGGETITYTQGTVSGFERLEYKGLFIPYRIKTDAKINPGNSGGGAFNDNDKFVGIPSAGRGGPGNIGYIISLPVINTFLQNSLGKQYMNNIGSETPSSEGVFSGVLPNKIRSGSRYVCPKFSELDTNGHCKCRTGFFAVGSTCIIANTYCAAKNLGTYDLFIQKCTLDPALKSNPTVPIHPIASPEPAASVEVTAPSQPTAIIKTEVISEPESSMPLKGIYDPKKKDLGLISRLLGRILLQVEEHGEAWYLNPINSSRHYLANGVAAYEVMRSMGLGMRDIDLKKIPSVVSSVDMLASSSACNINKFANKYRGRILLQVEQHGEAWYIDPRKCRKIYLKDGDAAYQVMRLLGTGILNSDLEKIPTLDISHGN